MLVSQEQIFALYCKYSNAKKTKYTCTYPLMGALDSVLYEGVTGLVLTVLFLLLHLLVFWLNRYIKEDFVKCFTTAIAMPLAFGEFFRFFQILFSMIYNPLYFIVEIFNHLYTVSLTCAFITTFLSIGCFLYMHAIVLCTGKAPSMEDSWSLFLSLEIIGWMLSGIFNFTSTNYRKMPAIAMVSIMCIFFVLKLSAILGTIFSLCCCGNRRHKNQDPVVAHGAFRAFWALASLLFAVPSFFAYSYFYSDVSNLIAGVDMTVAVDQFFTYRILEFAAGPYMIICLALLPTYRDAVVTCFRATRKAAKCATKGMGLKSMSSAPLISARQQIFPQRQQPAIAGRVTDSKI